ncbi:MAG: putative lipid II flippase FtsW [Microthrixaceae bacterium]
MGLTFTPRRREGTRAGQSRPTRSSRRRSPAPMTPSAILLVALVAGLSGMGLLMVLSASAVKSLDSGGSPYRFFARQAAFVGLGALAMWGMARFDLRKLRQLAVPMLGVAFGLLLLVAVPGNPLAVEVNGSRRWLGAGFAQFQPSELAKIALIVFAADLLADRRHQMGDPVRTVRPVMVVLGLFAAFVMLQPDLGTTVLLAIIAFAVLSVAGARPLNLATYAVPAAMLGAVASMWGYRKARMLAFLDPWEHPTTSGYQTLQAQVGLASGGWFGSGIGTSRAKYGFLPEAHTDFVYAIIGEEFGLVGALVIQALYLLFFLAGLRVARRAQDRFSKLVATGISTWIGVQAFINLGVATGALPNKGITLPFLSYGGTSIIVTMAAAGILVNIARTEV